jgi:hypothetical protein
MSATPNDCFHLTARRGNAWSWRWLTAGWIGTRQRPGCGNRWRCPSRDEAVNVQRPTSNAQPSKVRAKVSTRQIVQQLWQKLTHSTAGPRELTGLQLDWLPALTQDRGMNARQRLLRMFSWLLFTCAAATVTWAADPADSGPWIQLFNGKNLEGWTPKITGYDLNDNFGNTFRVEDGLLKVSFDQYQKFDGKFGHIFYKQAFSNYVVRVEYRFVGEQTPGGPGWAFRNSGIMLHCQAPESMEKNQDFPVSIEVQLLGGSGSGKRTTANLCSPGTHVVMDGKLITQHCINSTSKTYHGDQWVTVEVEVHGNKLIKHIVEGETVLSYSQPQLDETDANARKLLKGGDKMLHGGYISLQAESHPVQFRKVELRPLKD